MRTALVKLYSVRCTEPLGLLASLRVREAEFTFCPCAPPKVLHFSAFIFLICGVFPASGASKGGSLH